MKAVIQNFSASFTMGEFTRVSLELLVLGDTGDLFSSLQPGTVLTSLGVQTKPDNMASQESMVRSYDFDA